MFQWVKEVTGPAQLVAFALAILFTYLARVERNDERRWVFPVALSAAVFALFVGLGLMYLQITKSVPASSAQNDKTTEKTRQQTNSVAQNSSGVGSNNVQGVQGNVTIQQYLGGGKPPVKPPAEPLPKRDGSEPRPWVSVERLAATSPLTFNPSGNASAAVQFLLRDNDKTPAADVDVRGKLFAMQFVGASHQDMKDAESAFCDRFQTQQDQADKFSLYMDKPVQKDLSVDLHQIYLEEAINKSQHGFFQGMNGGAIPVAMILCIDYRSPFAKEHHQSQYALQFVIPADRVGNSFSVLRDGFEPKGSYPDAVVIGLDQTID